MLAQDLPNELWYQIFLFVDDYDLPVLERVNKLFRSVINDSWLRFLIQNENQLRVTGKLRNRPERTSLVSSNIMRGHNPSKLLQLMQRGDYVDVLMNRMYNVGTTLKRKRARMVLDRMLSTRPEQERLESLFRVPRRIAPSLHQRFTKLEYHLKRNLAKKKIISIDYGKKLGDHSSTSNLLAPMQVIVRRNVVQKVLKRNLIERKDPFDLFARGILTELQLVSLVCPAVKPKILYYEGMSARKLIY